MPAAQCKMSFEGVVTRDLTRSSGSRLTCPRRENVIDSWLCPRRSASPTAGQGWETPRYYVAFSFTAVTRRLYDCGPYRPSICGLGKGYPNAWLASDRYRKLPTDLALLLKSVMTRQYLPLSLLLSLTTTPILATCPSRQLWVRVPVPPTSKQSSMLPWPSTPSKLTWISATTHSPQRSRHAIPLNPSLLYSKNKPKHLTSFAMAILD
jgi:hypothetical protein